MKRLLTSAAAAAMLVAGTGSGAQAQGARASLFDLGVYGGVAYHYNWLEDLQGVGFAEDRLNPGIAPVAGAAATFWTSPNFGIRTNVTYSWIDMPDNSIPEGINGWFYDLNAVFRPWFVTDASANLMSSLYFFLGGGGFTANPPHGGPGCVQPYVALAGACLPLEADKASVGQGTAGLGFDVIAFTPGIGLFAEIAANGYDSPFHTGPGWTGMPDNERDTFGWTGRLVAGLKFAFGELAPAYVPPPVAPPAPPVMPPPPPPAPTTRTISVCVVQDGTLREVSATFTPSTGDTVINNRRFSEVYPATAPTYASGTNWYINNDSITVAGEEYVRFGVARVITPPSQLVRVGEFQGTTLYGQTGEATPHEVLYVPLRPGCEFQPYQRRQEIRVRG